MEKQTVFEITPPSTTKIPFILSIPHSGTAFPKEFHSIYQPNQLERLDDTDWFLEELYDFAPSLGITVIKANFSRWLIDLNRDPENKSLYNDGRIITSICPKTNFLGESIYRENYELNDSEIMLRLKNYYWPYHLKIKELISDFSKDYSQVFFWDAHSISRYVPTINPDPFPDLIIGDNEGNSCKREIRDICYNKLKKSNYNTSLNTPFKGGYLTRSVGNPKQNVNAIQLEMSKDLYMEEKTTSYNSEKAAKLKTLLKETFELIIKEIS